MVVVGRVAQLHLEGGEPRPILGRATIDGRHRRREFRQPATNLPGGATQIAATAGDVGRQQHVADLVRQPLGIIQIDDRTVRVGVASHPGQAVEDDRPIARRALLPLQERQGRLEALCRRKQRVGASGAFARTDEPRRRARVASALEVRGDRVGIGPRPRGQGLARPPVPATATGRQQPLIQCLADERVGEAQVGIAGGDFQQPRLGRALNHRQQHLLRGVGNRRPERQRHLLADDCGHRQQVARIVAQPRQPTIDHLPQQGRDARSTQIAERPGRPVRS